ncbi:MAG: ABC transporter permease, partial [Lachnospiraceae bacterium]|nr:ABC transporter permease [Lachnospiraceae bacterium]
IDHSVKEEIDSLSGVEMVFGCSYAPDTQAEINGAMGRVELVSYDDVMFEWSKNSVVSGDISKITVDSNYALTIFNMDSRLNTGDKVKIGDTELEIACVVSEGIGVEGISVVCTEETFARITGEDKYISLNAQLTEDATEETVDQIKALSGEYEFEDRREENHDSNSAFWVFRIGAYGFLTIIALITVFNIMNSISMSVSARMKQYGAMRAVGMSAHQMTKMISAEAVTYAVCGLIIGCVAGLYLHRLLTVKLIIEHFGGAWKIPFEPIAIIILIFVSACVVAVYTPSKNIKNMAITDTINEL